MKVIDSKALEKLRKMYPIGAKAKLVKMDDVQAPPVGTMGVVEFIDDIGTIHIKWENASSLN